MDKRIKLIGLAVAGLVVILTVATVGRELFSTNDAGYYQIKQAAVTGDMTVHNEPGTYLRLFGNITTYHVSDMYYFSKSNIDGGDGEFSDPISIRFNDGGTAKVSGGIKFRLPADPQLQLLIHRDFRTYQNLMNDLIRQTVTEALMQTATLMRAEESYSTRRSEFTSLVEGQVRDGIYETTSQEVKKKDADGNEFVERVVNVARDKDGKPIIRKVSPFKTYHIEIVQFVIKDLDFDATIDNLIAKKKEAEQMKVVAKANAEKAKQDAITAEAQGEAQIATEKAKQEVEKIKAVTIAQKNFEVSQLQRKQAEQDAAAVITKGKADAEINHLKVVAGLTPLERATIEKETRIGVAHELAGVQFPSMMVIGGGGGSNGNAMNPFDAVGLESFMRINDRLEKENTLRKSTQSAQRNAVQLNNTSSDSGSSNNSSDDNN